MTGRGGEHQCQRGRRRVPDVGTVQRRGIEAVKALAYWLAGFVIAFGGLALIINAVRETERVFVVVDSSFPMTVVWDQVPGQLDQLDDARFTEFALASEKRLIHTWDSRLDLAGTDPFAPCNFDEIEAYAEVEEADELILITTIDSCDTSSLTEAWDIVLLEP